MHHCEADAADRTVKDIRRKTRLAGDTARDANTGEVQNPRREARDLNEAVAAQKLTS